MAYTIRAPRSTGRCSARLPSALLSLAAAMTASVLPLQGQSTLPDNSRGARVQMMEVAVLSFGGLDVAPDVMARVFRVPGSRWAVSSSPMGATVSVFDRDGVFVEAFGRKGQGPGEFAGPVTGVQNGEELWVVDSRNGRITRLSADLEIIDTRPIPGRARYVAPAADSDRVLLTGFFGQHAIARVGADPAQDVTGGRIPDVQSGYAQRAHAAESGDEIWTVALQGGAVQVMRSTDLGLSASFRLPFKSFEQFTPFPNPPPSDGKKEAPPPSVFGLMADGQGLIWVIAVQPDARWSSDGDLFDDPTPQYDTFVAAIDVQSRSIVGKGLIDDVCLPADSGLLSCVNQLGESIRIVRLRLAREAGNGRDQRSGGSIPLTVTHVRRNGKPDQQDDERCAHGANARAARPNRRCPILWPVTTAAVTTPVKSTSSPANPIPV